MSVAYLASNLQSAWNFGGMNLIGSNHNIIILYESNILVLSVN